MQAQPSSVPEPVHLFWIGMPPSAQLLPATVAAHLRVTLAETATAAGLLRQPAPLPDVVVIDATSSGLNVHGLLGQCALAGIDLPVVLLVAPEQHALGALVAHLAVCDVVIKGDGAGYQLLATLSQVRARHDLLALFRGGRAVQDRLRTVLEFQPAVTCAVGPDGLVAAINLAGLALVGTDRDQVVGVPLTAWIPADQRQDVEQLLRHVLNGEARELDHDLARADGRTVAVRTRAVPLRNGHSVAVLVTLHERPEFAALRDARAEAARLQAECADWQARVNMLDAALSGERGGWSARDQAASAERQRLETELAAERVRLATLSEALSSAQTVAAGVEPLRAAITADCEVVAHLRDELTRLAREADERCRLLMERQDASLAGLHYAPAPPVG